MSMKITPRIGNVYMDTTSIILNYRQFRYITSIDSSLKYVTMFYPIYGNSNRKLSYSFIEDISNQYIGNIHDTPLLRLVLL